MYSKSRVTSVVLKTEQKRSDLDYIAEIWLNNFTDLLSALLLISV